MSGRHKWTIQSCSAWLNLIALKNKKKGKEKEHHESQQQLSYVKQTEQQWRSQVVGKGWRKSENWDRSSSFFVFTSQAAASAPFVVLNVSAQYVQFSDFSWFFSRMRHGSAVMMKMKMHSPLISPLAQSCKFHWASIICLCLCLFGDFVALEETAPTTG